MITATLKTRLFWAAEALMLAATVTAAALTSRADEWQPMLLVALLLGLTLVGHRLSAVVGGGLLTTAHIALVLAMCLLGVAPAVFCGLSAAVLTSGYRRVSPSRWLNNLVTFAVFPFVGALMSRALAGDIHSGAAQKAAESIEFGLI